MTDFPSSLEVVKANFRSYLLSLISVVPLLLVVFWGILQHAKFDEEVFRMIRNRENTDKIIGTILLNRIFSELGEAQKEATKYIDDAELDNLRVGFAHEILRDSGLSEEEKYRAIRQLIAEFSPQNYKDITVKYGPVIVPLDLLVVFFFIYTSCIFLHSARCIKNIRISFRLASEKSEISNWIQGHPSWFNILHRLGSSGGQCRNFAERRNLVTKLKLVQVNGRFVRFSAILGQLQKFLYRMVSCFRATSISDLMPAIAVGSIMGFSFLLMMISMDEGLTPWSGLSGTARGIAGISPLTIICLMFLSLYAMGALGRQFIGLGNDLYASEKSWPYEKTLKSTGIITGAMVPPLFSFTILNFLIGI